MKILITGSNGFIAKNLIEHLKTNENLHLYLFDKKDSLNILETYVKEVDFIFHLAGVNRPKDITEFYEGNSNLTKNIVNILKENKKNTPILFSSSIQSNLDNDYGKSKLEAEKILLEYSKSTQAKVFIYKLPNVFGKWSKPNYNSVISTWCYNIANNLDIQINDEKVELNLVYIDDVIKSFIKQLEIKEIKDYYVEIETIYKKTLAEIRDLLFAFKENRTTLLIPNVASGFERALYATYLSYLPTDDFSYTLNGHKDERGTFYEILKTLNSGQFSLSTTAPGITRGNHYHHTKNEKFLVVRGEALIEFRHIVTNEIISYKVSDKKMQIVEMIPGYTHNIKNTGTEEMILILWANETFDQKNPDTYFLKVRDEK
ncbi:capsular biosynthesis protein [Malaciobacter mytili LMG 24559]|uniref:Capsular biosynthesis protein n=1 Tax=Malaciobacter mytili LMG 24559 TaxID=1032238 RepID=A0AAX2AC57_9BACT|nr:NAD-dependent epimerase/dehydratase family protein [Malaciobacter mytili]AXH14501.1 polysaccharide biosynthesis protein [Malaciobacter mytili LMG 24559]RXK11579.1 capsular biosynthesis protein [Malaciobacter mytili LMG 24559]